MTIDLGLICLTPGAFVAGTNYQDVYHDFITESQWLFTFFDEARVLPYTADGVTLDPNGWVSRYGSLNGGSNFFASIEENAPSAVVSWDFNNTDYALSRIYVFGQDSSGLTWESLYTVTATKAFCGTVDLANNANIGGIAFYGRTSDMSVPDTALTSLLLGATLVTLTLFRRLFS